MNNIQENIALFKICLIQNLSKTVIVMAGSVHFSNILQVIHFKDNHSRMVKSFSATVKQKGFLSMMSINA